MDSKIVKMVSNILGSFYRAPRCSDYSDTLERIHTQVLAQFPGYEYITTSHNSYLEDFLINLDILMSANKSTLDKWVMTAEEREERIEDLKSQIEKLQQELEKLS
jgi:hypothetical protein